MQSKVNTLLILQDLIAVLDTINLLFYSTGCITVLAFLLQFYNCLNN